MSAAILFLLLEVVPQENKKVLYFSTYLTDLFVNVSQTANLLEKYRV